MSQENPKIEPEDIEEIIPDFVKKEGTPKPPYSFQTRGEFFEEFEPRRLKPGDEDYKHVYKRKVKPRLGDAHEPKDEHGVTRSQEYSASRVLYEDLEDIVNTCWWLMPEYQGYLERGELTEQVVFSVEIGEKKRLVDVYVFGESLPDVYKYWLSYVINYLAQIDEGAVFNLIKSIIIHNSTTETQTSLYDESSGKIAKVKTAARTDYALEIIEVFHGALDESLLDGMEEFPYFAKAIIHEFGHFIHTRTLRQGWEDRLGWEKETKKEVDLRKDGTPKLMRKKRKALIPKHGFVPPTKYAFTNPKEDFAESLAFLLLEPDKLNPKKRDWLIEEVIKQKAVLIKDRPKVEMVVWSGEKMILPRVTRNNLSYDNSYRVELGRKGMGVFWEKVKLRSESKKVQERIKKFLPKDAQDIQIDATPRLNYDWWTRKVETKEIFDGIRNNEYIERNVPISMLENILRYFSPEFIEGYFEDIFNELEGIGNKPVALRKFLAKKMLELSAMIASKMDLREDLSLLASIQHFYAYYES